MTATSDLLERLHTVLRNVLVGYPLASLDDKFLRAPNPHYKSDNGQDPYIVIDVAEAADLLASLTAPGDEGLNVTEDELNDLLTVLEHPKDKAEDFFLRLGRSVQFLRAKLRAAEKRADRAAKALGEMTSGALGYTDVAALKARADRYEAALQWIDENCDVYEIYSVARRALNTKAKL
jgi:hypothetical protein